MNTPGSENAIGIMFYVYVIENLTGDLYMGYTKDLRNRLKEHNRKENFSTKNRGPWNLIYYEACLNIKDAKRREGYLKTSQGRRLLKRRLKEFFAERNRISTTGYAR